jgi:hypothetical protein
MSETNGRTTVTIRANVDESESKALNELGRVAYEESIRGCTDRLPWHQLSASAQAHHARIELASRKAEVRDSERRWAEHVKAAELGTTSPTRLMVVK